MPHPGQSRHVEGTDPIDLIPAGSVHAGCVGGRLYREGSPVIEPQVEVVHPLRAVGIARLVLAVQEFLQWVCRPTLIGQHVGESTRAGDDLGYLVARFAAQDAKFAQVDVRFGRLEDAVGEINVKLAALISPPRQDRTGRIHRWGSPTYKHSDRLVSQQAMQSLNFPYLAGSIPTCAVYRPNNFRKRCERISLRL